MRDGEPSMMGESDGGRSAPRQDRLSAVVAQIDPDTLAEQIEAAKRERAGSTAQTQQPTSQPEPTVTQTTPAVTQATPAAPAAAPPQAPPVGASSGGPATNPSAAATPRAGTPDLSALRYFASRGDTARLEAEIARLRLLYPDWTPPEDPLAIPVTDDTRLDQMWKLYSEGRYAEVRQAIAERRTAEPAWVVPTDLSERLNVAETRARLVNASDLKQYDSVIQLAASTPMLLNCSDVDVLWRVAEAFVLTDRKQRGIDAYSYVLTNCTDPQQRIATVQKAAALLDYADVQPLIATEGTGQDGQREFETIRDELARRFVAEANETPSLRIAPDYVARLRTLATADQLASDSLLLGWYYLRRQDMAEAEKWFSASREIEDTASASQGLTLTLIARKDNTRAEDVMFLWRDDSEEATATYLAATANLIGAEPLLIIAEPVLQRVATAVIAKKYVPTAQQFGWYARALNQPQTALRWFETALSWKADDEPSAYGLAITRAQLNDQAGVAAIQQAWSGRSARIANLGMIAGQGTERAGPIGTQAATPAAGQPATQAGTATVTREVAVSATTAAPTTVNRPAMSAAPMASAPSVKTGRQAGGQQRGGQGCAATVNINTLTAAQALSRGWCLMDVNRPMEAAEAFEAALSSPSATAREDAAYGQSLAYLRLGLTSSAAVAAAKSPQRAERSSELQVSILSNRAISAFETKRYREAIVYLDQRALLQPEPVDLMVLRAYSLMNMGYPQDAKRIFETLAETGNRDAIRGLVDVRNLINKTG